MSETTPTQKTIYADQERNAMRLLIPVFLLIGFCLWFFLLNALFDRVSPAQDFGVFLACLGAISLGLLLAGTIETILKRMWRGGQPVLIAPDGIELPAPSGERVLMHRDRSLNVLSWYFPLANYPRGGRERRVPGKYFCFAVQIQQDEHRATFFSFLSPKRKEEYLLERSFQRLEPSEVYDRTFFSRVTLPSRPEIPPEVIAGKSGRQWLAERERWHSGLELTAEDFAEMMKAIDAYEIHY